ncbi:hypothetical protein B566_EDAN002842 [Ephemera danica]|nr:hypothetical protein B566_EDAN002842 [Ephemera danica]
MEYKSLLPWLGEGLLNSKGAKWHSRRKLLTPTFHFSILEQFVPIFCDKTRILVEKLQAAASTNPDGFDIVPYITRCTLDLICGKIGELVYHRTRRPWLRSDWIYKLTSNGRKHENCLRILHDFTDKVKLQTHSDLDNDIGKKKRIAFLDLLLATRKKKRIAFLDLLLATSENDSSLTDEEIRAESRCVEELEEIFNGSADRDPNITDLGNMKYLERVIKESLRLRPPVRYIGRKKFDPDRFLPENCVGRHPYAYLPFSAGPRNCIGQRFAMLEMKEVISTVLSHFRLESCNPEFYGVAYPNIILKPMNGLRTRIFPLTIKNGDSTDCCHRSASDMSLAINKKTSTSGPKHLETVLSSTEHIAKSHEIYDFFRDWLGDGLLISKGAKWHSRRKLLTPAFHFSILEQFVPVFCDKTRILVEKLKSAASANPDGVDIVPYVTRCALDIICQTAMGQNIRAQDDQNSLYVTTLYEMSDLIVHRAKKKIAFLDLLLQASEKDSSFTDDDIRAEVDTFMFEGHDTTAMGMSWTLYFLSIYPDIQSRCVEELEEIFSGSDRDPTITDLNNMKYLERVIKETLRLKPPVTGAGRSLENNLKLEGYDAFPAKTSVHINIYNTHRNPAIYPDPEKFDPDRFLPENCIGRHPYAYIPFSAGPRNCIGQRFAMFEMKEVISTLLRHFRLESCDSEFYGTVMSSTDHIAKGKEYDFIAEWLGYGLLISKGAKWHSRRKLLTPAFHFSILEQFVPVFCDKTRILVEKLQIAATANPDGFDIVPYVTRDRNGLSPSGRGHDECLKVLHSFTSKVIRERRCELQTVVDDGSVSESDAKFGNVLRNEEIRAEVDTFMFEGHDTTAMGISWTLYYLSIYPEIQVKGYDPFPANTIVHLYIYKVHRNPEIYPEPEKFDPDRFLPENCVARHPYAYIPFSAGPRNCIGQRFAMLEMKEVVSTMLRHFRFESCDPEYYGVAFPDLILRPEHGLKTRIYPRSKWHSRRKLLTPAFHFSILEQFVPVFCDKTPLFIDFNKIYQSFANVGIFRTWLTKYIPIIHVTAPKHLETILSNVDHISKGRDYDFLAEWLGYSLLISNGAKWHSRRKLLTPAFHFSILEQFVPVFCDKTRIFVEKLRSASTATPEGVNIVPYVTRCALDIICLYELSDLLVVRVFRPWLHPGWLFRLFPIGRRHDECLKILHDFTKKVIRERRETFQKPKLGNEEIDKENVYSSKKRTAFLDLLLSASENDPSLTDEEIRAEVDTFMFEGHDTTAMGMSWMLYYISAKPEVQEIFCGSDRDPNLSDLGKMKYLERVIKETLRLRPSVVTISRASDNNLKLEGYDKFPAKTAIHVNIYNTHRNPEIYPEPEKFDPDRFLPENCVGRHPYAYIPFSAGPRNCIGQKFAMLEMKAVVSTLLRHFRLESCDPEKYGEAFADIILRPKYGLMTRLYPR